MATSNSIVKALDLGVLVVLTSADPAVLTALTIINVNSNNIPCFFQLWGNEGGLLTLQFTAQVVSGPTTFQWTAPLNLAGFTNIQVCISTDPLRVLGPGGTAGTVTVMTD